MKVKALRFLPLGLLAAVYFFMPTMSQAQAPPGPLPTPATPKDAPVTQQAPPPPLQPPRDVILGKWKLNADQSEDGRKKLQDARSGDKRAGPGGGGGGMPGGIGIGRRGGYGGSDGESDQERQKMQELINPANKIALSMTGAEVDLMDDQNRKRAFMTDGRKLQKSKDVNYEEIAAHWDGKMLVTDEKDPHGNKMSRTFELSSEGRELYETVHMKVGRSETPVVIHYVYDEAL